jgi:hypothetical protein
MSVSALRTIVIAFSGDTTGTQSYPASVNMNSPGDIDVVSLVSGDNVIPVPAGGTVPRAVTILKDPNNTVALKLKGAAPDTGHPLGLTDPDSFTLALGATSIILNALSGVNVRLVWS